MHVDRTRRSMMCSAMYTTNIVENVVCYHHIRSACTENCLIGILRPHVGDGL